MSEFAQVAIPCAVAAVLWWFVSHPNLFEALDRFQLVKDGERPSMVEFIRRSRGSKVLVLTMLASAPFTKVIEWPNVVLLLIVLAPCFGVILWKLTESWERSMLATLARDTQAIQQPQQTESSNETKGESY